jgi:integrase
LEARDFLRWFLNGIFKLALSDALIQGNPAAELKIPRKCQAGRAMWPLTEEEVNKYLEVVDLLEKLIARLAIFEGMRQEVILALLWKAVAGETIRAEESAYKRVLNPPKNGKTRKGAISDGTIELLKEWAGLALDSSPDGIVFPSEEIPLSLDNLWWRSMFPKLEKVALGLGDISGIAQNQRQPVEGGGHRSQGCLRPEGPRDRRKHGSERSRSEPTRRHIASTTCCRERTGLNEVGAVRRNR